MPQQILRCGLVGSPRPTYPKPTSHSGLAATKATQKTTGRMSIVTWANACVSLGRAWTRSTGQEFPVVFHWDYPRYSRKFGLRLPTIPDIQAPIGTATEKQTWNQVIKSLPFDGPIFNSWNHPLLFGFFGAIHSLVTPLFSSDAPNSLAFFGRWRLATGETGETVAEMAKIYVDRMPYILSAFHILSEYLMYVFFFNCFFLYGIESYILYLAIFHVSLCRVLWMWHGTPQLNGGWPATQRVATNPTVQTLTQHFAPYPRRWNFWPWQFATAPGGSHAASNAESDQFTDSQIKLCFFGWFMILLDSPFLKIKKKLGEPSAGHPPRPWTLERAWPTYAGSGPCQRSASDIFSGLRIQNYIHLI